MDTDIGVRVEFESSSDDDESGDDIVHEDNDDASEGEDARMDDTIKEKTSKKSVGLLNRLFQNFVEKRLRRMRNSII